jgi:hypothetical protein
LKFSPADLLTSVYVTGIDAEEVDDGGVAETGIMPKFATMTTINAKATTATRTLSGEKAFFADSFMQWNRPPFRPTS